MVVVEVRRVVVRLTFLERCLHCLHVMREVIEVSSSSDSIIVIK